MAHEEPGNTGADPSSEAPGRELASEPPVLDPIEDDPDQDDRGPLRAFFGLFLVPLLVVLVCVGVFVGFGWIAYDQQDTQDYLNDLRSSWRPRRAQAAYELSKILTADPDALAGQPEVAAEVRRLFGEAEDPEIRRYLALVLGYTRDEASVERLTQALEEEPDSQTRIYLLWALGAIGDADAIPALAERLASEDPGVRKVAAYALGQLGEPLAVARLEPLLDDEVADVRWNAALSVSTLGSDRGVPVLERMLDRSLTEAVSGITPEQQEETMVQALSALARVGSDRHLPLLASLADSDPSYRVRQAALEAQQVLSGQG